VKLDRADASMLRWKYALKLKARKRSGEITEWLGLEPVSLDIKKSKLR